MQQKKEDSSASQHIASRYATRIAGNHRWTGTETDYQAGVRDIKKSLPDTTFVVSYVNDTTVQVGKMHLPYFRNPYAQDSSRVRFYQYDKSTGKNHTLTYYIEGDSLQYEEVILPIYGHHRWLYSAH